MRIRRPALAGKLRKGAVLCDLALGWATKGLDAWVCEHRAERRDDRERQVVELILVVDGVRCASRTWEVEL